MVLRSEGGVCCSESGRANDGVLERRIGTKNVRASRDDIMLPFTCNKCQYMVETCPAISGLKLPGGTNRRSPIAFRITTPYSNFSRAI